MTRSNLHLVTPEEPARTREGPSDSFLALTRNPAIKPPVRFVPTKKQPGDIVI